MTPDKRAKNLGAPSALYVAEKACIPSTTFRDWARTKPARFDAICKLVVDADKLRALVESSRVFNEIH